MRSGDLYVLESWTVPEEGQDLVGSGVRFDMDRVGLAAATHRIPVADIALLETNEKEVVSRFSQSGLSVFTSLSALATLACLADPKSCFGSCPTFYSVDDPDRPLAEGFSSSFAASLEKGDLDRLGLRAGPGPMALVMRNEAQETHAIRHVRLLAAPVPEGGDVALTSDGDLFETSGSRPPHRCESQSGDCLHEVTRRDDVEYAPRTDETDLAVREEVFLDFGAARGEVGLILSARNSFVTTYVFYQSLAYAGRRTGDLLAALERGVPEAERQVLGVARELGGIEVLVEGPTNDLDISGRAVETRR